MAANISKKRGYPLDDEDGTSNARQRRKTSPTPPSHIRINPLEQEMPIYLHPVWNTYLKPHQIEGIQFLWKIAIIQQKGGLLAHTMGLGKTLQVIVFLHTLHIVRADSTLRQLLPEKLRTIERNLILVPSGLLLNWNAELRFWEEKFPYTDRAFFAAREIISAKHEFLDRIDTLQYWFNRGGTCILGYSLLQRLLLPDNPRLFANSDQDKRVHAAIRKCLVEPGPNLVIADEAHVLKNKSSKIAKAADMCVTEMRVALTGTPLANNINEYLSIMRWVQPKADYSGRLMQMTDLSSLGESFNQVGDFIEARALVKKKQPARVAKGGRHAGGSQDAEGGEGREEKKETEEPPIVKPRPKRITMDDFVPFINSQKDDLEQDTCASRLLIEQMISAFSPLVHRRTASVIANEFGHKTEFVIRVPLTDLQLAIYSAFTSYFYKHLERVEGAHGDNFLADPGSSILWRVVNYMRTLCNHPQAFHGIYYRDTLQHLRRTERRKPQLHGQSCGSDDSEVSDKPDLSDDTWLRNIYQEFTSPKSVHHSNKMTLLLAILKECKRVGDKVLLFTHNIASLDYLEKLIRSQRFSLCRLDGSIPFTTRAQETTCFNTGSHDVYLISTKAGGMGLNLQVANRVIILDTDFSPMWEEQAVGRSYRMKQKKHVYVYHLCTEGSVETKLVRLKHWKHRLADLVVDQRWERRKVVLGENDLVSYKEEPRKVERRRVWKGEEFWLKDKEVLDKVMEQAGVDGKLSVKDVQVLSRVKPGENKDV